jgi:hypothetical protein
MCLKDHVAPCRGFGVKAWLPWRVFQTDISIGGYPASSTRRKRTMAVSSTVPSTFSAFCARFCSQVFLLDTLIGLSQQPAIVMQAISAEALSMPRRIMRLLPNYGSSSRCLVSRSCSRAMMLIKARELWPVLSHRRPRTVANCASWDAHSQIRTTSTTSWRSFRRLRASIKIYSSANA